MTQVVVSVVLLLRLAGRLGKGEGWGSKAVVAILQAAATNMEVKAKL